MAASDSRSAQDTERLGAALARGLKPGDVVLVSGEMGAGKSTFVRGALRALGVTGRVTSPTYTLGRRYDEGRVPASHLDLHRLGDLAGEDPALLADYVDADHVAFVEWPEVAGAAFGDRVVARVVLEHGGHDVRRVTVSRP